MNIRLLSVYSNDMIPLKDNLLSSFKDDIPIDLECIDVEGAFFPNDQYYKALLQKCKIIGDYIGDNIGNILIFSDVDIDYYKPVVPFIDKYFLPSDNQVMFMLEREQCRIINSGLVVMKCTEDIYNFYKDVYYGCEEDFHRKDKTYSLGDQSFINRHFRSYNIKFGFLPEQFRSNERNDKIPEDLIAFHANGPCRNRQKLGTWSENKINRILEFRREYENSLHISSR